MRMNQRVVLGVAAVCGLVLGGLSSPAQSAAVYVLVSCSLPADVQCDVPGGGSSPGAPCALTCPPPLGYACADAIDNDGDGATDFPSDLGCTGPTDDTENEACNDGTDNDGDGVADSADPGCSSGTDQSEQDPTTECDDGLDNDADGLVDGSDPWCSSLTDDSEAGPATISNGGFESTSGGSCPPTGWTSYEYNSGASCIVSSPTLTGLGAVSIYDGSTSGSAGITSSCVEVHPGDTVTALAWFRGTSPPDPNAYFGLYLEFFGTASPSGSGQRIAVEWDQWPASSTTWDDKSVSKVAPANSVCAWVLLYSSTGANGTYYVDDVSLTVA